ncbi:hypothetical protein N1F89_08575 [Aquibium sp. A9E412]|uniref:hypothetical protein n=1 Tax=Aquibium sp. A9E412 TaxID=2976767 RepID=UPI0025B01978|nr:hypothetical protein [Aquibium sp. A9E412]MDN2566274.1 hypothetical protein [Aquibium sp. A9E412]
MSGRTDSDDAMMRHQQAKDLGHDTDTRSQPERARDAERDSQAERLEDDARANRGIGALFRLFRRPSRTERVVARAAENNDRSRR